MEVQEPAMPVPTGDMVLVKLLSCALCTLEQRIYKGAMPYYPYAGGHEAAGVVESCGERVTMLSPGDKVTLRLLTSCGQCYYCRSGHENQCVTSFKASNHAGLNGPGGLADYMLVDARQVYKVSPDLDIDCAALAEPLACCVHSVGKGQIGLGDDVVVLGAGIMGMFHVMLAKRKGARVIVCEVDAARLEKAKGLGADVVVNPSECDPVEKVKELTEGRGANVVFCTVALPALAAQAIDMVGKLGRVVMYTSFHPKDPIELNEDRVHYSEIRITGSVNPDMRDFHTAVRLLSLGIIDAEPLISERVPFEKLDYAFEQSIKPGMYRVVVTHGR